MVFSSTAKHNDLVNNPGHKHKRRPTNLVTPANRHKHGPAKGYKPAAKHKGHMPMAPVNPASNPARTIPTKNQLLPGETLRIETTVQVEVGQKANTLRAEANPATPKRNMAAIPGRANLTTAIQAKVAGRANPVTTIRGREVTPITARTKIAATPTLEKAAA